jgi:cytoskeletal protein CcmA (bactofilin family)
MVDGVETRVVEDRETRNGQLIELTRDYYAADRVTGDVYGGDRLIVAGTVDGDVLGATTISGSGHVGGQKQESVQPAPVAFPALSPTDYGSYYHIRRSLYRVGTLWTEVLWGVRLHPTCPNPAGIHHRQGDLRLKGRIEIDGMLVVTHDLILEEDCAVVIRAVKNFPALLVGHDVVMRRDDGHLHIDGLAQVGGSICMGNKAGNTMEIDGALCIAAGGMEETAGCTLHINAAPDKAAIQLWRTPTTTIQWSPAGGAFFKHIERL